MLSHYKAHIRVWSLPSWLFNKRVYFQESPGDKICTGDRMCIVHYNERELLEITLSLHLSHYVQDPGHPSCNLDDVGCQSACSSRCGAVSFAKGLGCLCLCLRLRREIIRPRMQGQREHCSWISWNIAEYPTLEILSWAIPSSKDILVLKSWCQLESKFKFMWNRLVGTYICPCCLCCNTQVASVIHWPLIW